MNRPVPPGQLGLLSSPAAPHQAPPLWARPELRRVAGDTLRPGGLELTTRLAETMHLCPGMRVLDVGCGLGSTVRFLRRHFGVCALGLDLAPGTEHPSLPLIQGNADALPLPPDSMDAVFCECVLSLQHDPGKVLRELHRVLRPGGMFGLSDLYRIAEGQTKAACPTIPGNRSPETETSCTKTSFTQADLLEHLRLAGLYAIRFEDHSPLLRDLAAKLTWAGISPDACRSGAGYCLVSAHKPKPQRS